MAKMQLTPMTCTPHSDGWKCVCPCGYATHAKAGTAYHACQTSKPRARPGLGDMVKAGLSAVGITEERVSKAIGRPCGCSKRAEQLNAIGRKIGIG